VHELGISSDLVLANAALPRFVYWEGLGSAERLANLHALPTNLPGDLFTFGLLTWPGRIRAALGAVGLISPPPPAPYEESVREFVTRHLGEETFERIIDPFVSGVYAGDPDYLAMRSALKKIHRLEGLGDFGNGLVSGAITRFKEIDREKKDSPPDPNWPTYKSGELGSFLKGLSTLPNAIEAHLTSERVKLNHELVKIEKDPETNLFHATFKIDEETTKTYVGKTLVLTSPPIPTAKTVPSSLIPSADLLNNVYSPPVASVTCAIKKKHFRELPGGTPESPLRGFGHLLPRRMGIRSLGCIWSSSLFPNRCPSDYELLLTYIGGARDEEIGSMSEDEILEVVRADIKKVMLKEGTIPEDVELLGMRVWPRAIPQYGRGHEEILSKIADEEARVPGLWLGGNYRTGVAFGDCVKYGLEQASVVEDYLSTKK